MKERYKRIIAMFFALNILFEVVSPTVALALTSGPSQPEVQSFTPIATSDMVNVFSGDFNYNIPLLDIDGYPLNLAYNAGVGTDQEASWVGLGWNINPGTVNRGMRGLPDDFKGDQVHREINMKANQTFGINAGVGLELFGKKKESGGILSGKLNLGLGLNYNTYNGYGMDMSANFALSKTKKNGSSYTGSLGLSSGTEKGLGITADASFQSKERANWIGNHGGSLNRVSGSLGLAYNTVSGLSDLTFKYSVQRQKFQGTQNANGPSTIDSRSTLGATGSSFAFNFASPTYMPYSGPEMVNLGLNLNLSVGAEFFGTNPNFSIGAYYSGQFIKDKTKDLEAYGYLHSELNNNFGDAEHTAGKLHDFNREKDVSFTMHTPNLPVTNYSYDSFNYSGQGISGDFRPYRNQVGTVFDPYVKNFPSLSANIGVELGAGNLVHGGLNVEFSYTQTKNGKWTDNNNVEGNTLFAAGNNGFNESVYFKQGGEKTAETDMNYFNNVINGFQPVRLGLQVAGPETFLTKDLVSKYNATNTLNNNARAARVHRSEAINVLTASQAAVAGLETSIKNYPLNDFSSFYSGTGSPATLSRVNGNYCYKGHHISEITTTRDDGARYIYGIPAYNKFDKEASFAVEPGSGAIDYDKGLVSYGSGSDNTTNNSKGLDNYFDSQNLPGYAHAFLLTSVLSPDYVDKTLNGPTRDDLGKYTKFNYTKYDTGYKWRMPFGANGSNLASLNQALYSATGASGDDKASYSYGAKEVWYMHSIETKNYVAVFELEDRLDGLGVAGEDGGKDVNQKLQRLKEIRLYTRQELTDKQSAAVPLKTVHFEYDYSLCDKIDNNVYTAASPNPSGQGQGKLTLKKVWFTYQNSLKGKLSPYQFAYNTASSVTNYDYNPKAYDRWGNYKPNNPSTAPGGYFGTNSSSAYLLTSEFPYSEQEPTKADLYAAAWNLSKITLPSGAEINVSYEADDYAYVQDKKAMQMFVAYGAGNSTSTPTAGNKLYDTSPSVINDCMYINLDTASVVEVLSRISAGATAAQAVGDMFFKDENGGALQYLYFKYLVDVERNLAVYNDKYEYISGYAKINYSTPPTFISNKLVFKVQDVAMYDNIPLNVNTHPVTMAGINFVRKYMPRVAFDNNQDPFTSIGSNILALAQGIKSAFTPIVQFFKGGLANALRLSHASQKFVPQRSFVRLYSGRQFKKGGGCRVKQLQLTDNWSAQSGNAAISTGYYGQTYDYITKDAYGRNISSGVASYEPLIGGDENPFRQPVFFEEKHILAPDDDYYQETPYGEAMYPGPSVGYSRIVVRNQQRYSGASHVSRHATGAVVHEFYTAKDFPTKADKTDVKKERHQPNPVAKFLKFFAKDYMTTSQGYQVILNDMHGKPKAQWVYKEADPATFNNANLLDEYYGDKYISGVEYNYKRNLDQLSNDATVIDKTGQISTGMVGVDYDMVVDTRESHTLSWNGSTQGNVDGFLVAIFPGLVPTMFPGYSQEKVRYRSAVVTKVLYRYGLLDEVIAHDNGASVSTKNTLWSAETGDVVLTETKNNFSDPVYSLSYPAHWAYDRMGNASKNIGAQSAIVSGNISNAYMLVLGDEVLLNGTTDTRGWVKTALPTVQIIDNNGALVNLNNYSYLTVTRSGNRNQQNIPVAKVLSLKSPLVTSGSATSIYLDKTSKVIEASAAEFSDGWGVFCNCSVTSTTVINPFLAGQQGIFRPNTSYVYLTGRQQTNKSDNTNVRQDGPYLTFASFWSPNPNSAPYNWTKTTDPAWQFTSKTTLYSPYGFELENQDALNRSSAAIYGYGNTLPVAVSTNAKYSQVGFDGFEDYDYNNACENHFGFIQYSNGSSTVTYNKSSNNYISKPASQNQTYSHTGRKSIKVPTGTSVILSTPVQNAGCNQNTNPPIIY